MAPAQVPIEKVKAAVGAALSVMWSSRVVLGRSLHGPREAATSSLVMPSEQKVTGLFPQQPPQNSPEVSLSELGQLLLLPEPGVRMASDGASPSPATPPMAGGAASSL